MTPPPPGDSVAYPLHLFHLHHIPFITFSRDFFFFAEIAITCQTNSTIATLDSRFVQKNIQEVLQGAVIGQIVSCAYIFLTIVGWSQVHALRCVRICAFYIKMYYINMTGHFCSFLTGVNHGWKSQQGCVPLLLSTHNSFICIKEKIW